MSYVYLLNAAIDCTYEVLSFESLINIWFGDIFIIENGVEKLMNQKKNNNKWQGAGIYCKTIRKLYIAC